jgi:hypothetical protein
VRQRGEGAINDLEYPELHCLVYELCKIPQIEERLDCLIFRITYEESFSTYQKNLRTLNMALQTLQKKQEIIRRFFQTAHCFGQSCGRKLDRGFQLSTLDELSRTKSTRYPELSILHFVLALMDPEDAQALFDADDIATLQSASALKTDKVIQDALELTKGVYGVQTIFSETGLYVDSSGQEVRINRRRRSVVGRPGADLMDNEAPEIDTDDCFHEVMQAFVRESLQSAEDISEGALDAGLTYKELALFFDDLKSVYPPPRSSKSGTEDLLDIFCRFAEEIRKHRIEVDQKRVREMIEGCGGGGNSSNSSRLQASGDASFNGDTSSFHQQQSFDATPTVTPSVTPRLSTLEPMVTPRVGSPPPNFTIPEDE